MQPDIVSTRKTSPLLFLYYYLVRPAFTWPAGSAMFFLRRSKQTLFCILLVPNLLAFGVYKFEDKWPFKYLVPGVADRYGVISQGTVTRFLDGAVVKTRTTPFDLTRSIFGHLNCLDPTDSTKVLARPLFPEFTPSVEKLLLEVIVPVITASPATSLASEAQAHQVSPPEVSGKPPMVGDIENAISHEIEKEFPTPALSVNQLKRESQKLKKLNRPFSYSCATEIEIGTTAGFGGLWRKYPGYLLAEFVDYATMNVNAKPEFGASSADQTKVLHRILSYFSIAMLFLYPAILVILTYLVCLAAIGILVAVLITLRALRPQLTSPWPQGTNSAQPFSAILAVISDTHVTERGKLPNEVMEGYARFPAGVRMNTGEQLAVILKHIRGLSPRPAALVLAGDLVDLATSLEWAEFESVFKRSLYKGEVKPWDKPIVAIPGNHDVSINDGRSPDHFLTKRSDRLYACKTALATITGKEYPQKWEDAYPQLTELTIGCEMVVSVIGMDSQRYPSRQILSNAVGYLGHRQLSVLRSILCKRKGPIVILIHHHVSRPKRKLLGLGARLQETFKIAIDGDSLLKIAANYATIHATNKVLIVHGHQHEEFFQVYESRAGGKVHIYGHPSSTMGIEENGLLDGIARFALVGQSAQGDWIVKTVVIDE